MSGPPLIDRCTHPPRGTPHLGDAAADNSARMPTAHVPCELPTGSPKAAGAAHSNAAESEVRNCLICG